MQTLSKLVLILDFRFLARVMSIYTTLLVFNYVLKFLSLFPHKFANIFEFSKDVFFLIERNTLPNNQTFICD